MFSADSLSDTSSEFHMSQTHTTYSHVNQYIRRGCSRACRVWYNGGRRSRYKLGCGPQDTREREDYSHGEDNILIYDSRICTADKFCARWVDTGPGLVCSAIAIVVCTSMCVLKVCGGGPLAGCPPESCTRLISIEIWNSCILHCEIL